MSREPFTDEDSSPSAGLVASAVDMLVAYLPAIMAHPGKCAQMRRLFNEIDGHRFDMGLDFSAGVFEHPADNSNEDLI